VRHAISRALVRVMAKILGIDLGTTNSAMAIMRGGEPQILENSRAHARRLRLLQLSKTGERLVGLIARRQAVTNPKNTVYQIKRFIGHTFDEPAVQKDIAAVPFEVRKSAKRRHRGQDGRQMVPPGGNLGDDTGQAQSDARKALGRAYHRGGYHRACLL
jgi:molecular chaperone DnaK